MITLDGVMQAPGGPEEDTTGGFKYGGWTAPYGDAVGNRAFQELMEPADLLLGRKTYEIFAGFWPQHAAQWPGINEVTKYVVSNTVDASNWKNTVFLKSLDEVQNLKNSKGSDIKVWGSGELVQLLLENDLVDELWLVMYPLTLGSGKKLFEGGTLPAAFKLVGSTVTPTGVIIGHYARAGEVETGNLAAETGA